MAKAKKFVYSFGNGRGDGTAKMKNLLGGKGANLAEMAGLGVPVPPGFTITTDVCVQFMKAKGKYPSGLKNQVDRALAKTERLMKAKLGDPDNPLLVSVRSGARQSMPGMMETVLNIGLTTKTLKGIIKKTGNARLAYDAYRRLITMYSDVVMEKSADIEPAEGKGIRHQLEGELKKMKKKRKVANDTDLSADDLKKLCAIYKEKVKKVFRKPFPDDAQEQLWGGITAVFRSWNGKRAIAYRNIENIPHEWGTAVNVQTMVFGNMGDSSATGVAFTRNPATGENKFFGEFLINAQGEDVVAGTRTPQAINNASKTSGSAKMKTLEQLMPKNYKKLVAIRRKLERHYRDMQDLEFTIQEDKLYMLQTRVGKRNGAAAIKIAVDMVKERMISKKEAIMRVRPEQLAELLHPMIDPAAEKKAVKLTEGLPAGPGGASGQVVFTSEDAEEWAEKGRKVILIRNETSPEDVHGMHAAEAILTAMGGMTSHAALVARGWGKCCIVGCGDLQIDTKGRKMQVNGKTVKQGDVITLNGTKGNVYQGTLSLLPADPGKNREYKQLMKWADSFRKLGVRTNADTPGDSRLARRFGAEGIGLTRTEHMFFGPDRILAVRQMILADNEKSRRKALAKLLPYQKKDFLGIFKAMEGLPVTIRTLDPPLHEFLPHDEKQQRTLARALKISVKEVKAKVASLRENNPMLGHRGCRLGITYPEITEMQVRAIMEAACALTKKKIKVLPEIMIPLAGTKAELVNQRDIVVRVAEEVIAKTGVKVDYKVGTMIEIPRAALTADELAEAAEFFSFGTNDLTQMTFGYSRDDVGKFLPEYINTGILPNDPFQSIDIAGVGQLVALAIKLGRSTRKNLKIGICGEHGGDPASVEFCHRVGMNYVSCSPFRVPIARFAAAQAALR